VILCSSRRPGLSHQGSGTLCGPLFAAPLTCVDGEEDDERWFDEDLSPGPAAHMEEIGEG